jgi:leucyl/phenylalanyl-tRNA--protein transferase
MFHRETDASKVALHHLVETLRGAGFGLLDIQVLTAHTQSLGGVDIDRDDYLDLLAQAIRLTPRALRDVPHHG